MSVRSSYGKTVCALREVCLGNWIRFAQTICYISATVYL